MPKQDCGPPRQEALSARIQKLGELGELLLRQLSFLDEFSHLSILGLEGVSETLDSNGPVLVLRKEVLEMSNVDDLIAAVNRPFGG